MRKSAVTRMQYQSLSKRNTLSILWASCCEALINASYDNIIISTTPLTRLRDFHQRGKTVLFVIVNACRFLFLLENRDTCVAWDYGRKFRIRKDREENLKQVTNIKRRLHNARVATRDTIDGPTRRSKFRVLIRLPLQHGVHTI